MILPFTNIARLTRTFTTLQKQYKRQQQFTQDFLQKYQNWQPCDASFQKKDLRRMRDYPLQFIVFFADFFALMRGQALGQVERQRLTTYAALLCLYDDFFDEEMLASDEIWAFYQNPKGFRAQNTKQAICRDLWLELWRIYPRDTYFEEVFRKFHQNQDTSRKQYEGHHLPQSVIQQISFDKGGYALLLSRLLMAPPPDEQEAEAVYQLGAWFQILDDIVDIAKDRREKMATLMTTCQKIEELENILKQQTQIAFEAIKKLNYPTKTKNEALYRFQIIGTSGTVHLKRLKALQGEGSFRLDEYPEKEIQWIETRWQNYWKGLPILLKYT